MRELKMKVELDLELDDLAVELAKVTDFVTEDTARDVAEGVVQSAIDDLDVLDAIESDVLADKLSGYFAAEDDVLDEHYVREIAREEAGGLDEDDVVRIAVDQLRSMPSTDGSLCETGVAFRNAVQNALRCETTKELLKELFPASFPASGAIENGEIVEPPADEPVVTLHGVKLTDSRVIDRLSPTASEAYDLAVSTNRHGIQVTLQIPLSMARRVLAGDRGCSAREIGGLAYRLVPNAVYLPVRYDDGVVARCGEVVREFVAGHEPVTAECWVVVFNDRSVSGPYPTQAEARRYQSERAHGMDTVVRQATLPPSWS